MAVKNYRELIVWQKAMDLVERVYRLARRFPKDELYGLTSQLPRAAVSIPSNIAEGQGRRTTTEFPRFLSIANGSLKEVETQLLLAERLAYVDQQQTSEAMALTTDVTRLINALINSLEKKL